MLHSNNRTAQRLNEPSEVMTFQFSESQTEIQTLYLDGQPWLVAADICKILDLKNPTDRIKSLDDDEKLTYVIDRAGQKRETNLVNESGLYALIFKSRKPEAKAFRKWVTSEVLPTLRKKGYYAISHSPKNDYIDARIIPYTEEKFNGVAIRSLIVDGIKWFSINDINKAIGCSTIAMQSAKKLNAVQTLAIKIQLFGNTHPAWFTNNLGFRLLLSGSRVLRDNQQLSLNFSQEVKEVK